MAGWFNGLLGVLIFSGSLPATRVAVGAFSPLFLTAARAVIAALLGIALLALLRQVRPARRDLVSLTLVALGVVIGFPLLTALALEHITAARSTVFIGLLPLSTAIFGVLRGGERPRPAFWLFSCAGSALVAGFALLHQAEPADRTADASEVFPMAGDLLMVGAIVVCGLGYAEGAALSRRLGGWQVISWALIVSLPVTLAIGIFSMPGVTEPGDWEVSGLWSGRWGDVGAPAWISLGYVSVFSMLVGFVFWYRGLALGGIAAVGQLQLLQPFFGLLLAGLLLGEPVGWPMIAVTTLVVFCVAGARRFS